MSEVRRQTYLEPRISGWKPDFKKGHADQPSCLFASKAAMASRTKASTVVSAYGRLGFFQIEDLTAVRWVIVSGAAILSMNAPR